MFKTIKVLAIISLFLFIAKTLTDIPAEYYLHVATVGIGSFLAFVIWKFVKAMQALGRRINKRRDEETSAWLRQEIERLESKRKRQKA